MYGGFDPVDRCRQKCVQHKKGQTYNADDEDDWTKINTDTTISELKTVGKNTIIHNGEEIKVNCAKEGKK